MKRYGRAFQVAGMILSLMSPTTAYSVQPAEERRLELLERVESLKPTEIGLGTHDRWYWYDWGGWLTGTFTDYHNDEFQTSPAEAYREDVRVWAKVGVTVPRNSREYFGKQHFIYFRLNNAYQQEHLGDNDNDGPHVDMLYLQDDFDWKGFGRLKTRIGRRFFSIGRGIVYSNLHDGVDGTITLSPAQLKVFYSRTLPHEHNLDASVPGFDKHYEPHFFGVELELLKLSQHRPYGYYLLAEDSSDEDPVTETRDFHYNSHYYGLGSKGEFFLPNVRYFTEMIWERGRSIRSRSTESEGIKAYAVDSSLEFYLGYLGIYGQPVIKLEYARGSGDEDRNNATNTINGNEGGLDKNFLYFGHFTSGGGML